MFTKSFFAILALALVLPEQALARERWLERNGKAVLLHPRRFGQENPAVINKLSGLCPGQVCGTLAGSAISTLLAASPECAQQDKADEIIDASRQFDAATQAAMIAAAKEFRAAEKNTPPDFTTNPPTPRNSVFCQKAPKNSELNGIVQAQDPANGDVFFDPATKASVQRGAQPNTFPFGTAGSGSADSNSTSSTTSAADSANTAVLDTSSTSAAAATATDCAPDVTVTVTVSAATETAAATTSAAAAAATNGAATVGSADFGSCSVPQIEFATGFDNRRETSFQPVDRVSYNHGSAQNIDIITRAMCDQLTNTCKANQAAKDLCQQATAAADTQPAKTGGQADAFNKVFGIDTDFAAVQQVDDQGRPVGTPAAATGNAAAATTSAAAAAAATNGAATVGSADFGSCSVPQIEFATGFDNRRETSFQPVDRTSYNHGSAQNIDIITRAVCDQLTNTCKANQAAKDLCQQAIVAADTQPAKTGGQADAFNKVFGIDTDFAAVQQVDDQGRPVGTPAAATGNAAAATTVAAPSTAAAAATSSAAAATASAGTSAGGIGNFGKCTVPEIEFATGFDNRRETSFRPVDRTSYPHDSAQNGAIITQFICDTLVNTCGADQTARNTCQTARAAFDAATPLKSGAQADAFNAVFGKVTNFKAVAIVDNLGNVVSQ